MAGGGADGRAVTVMSWARSQCGHDDLRALGVADSGDAAKLRNPSAFK
jgi:hypothetical protein